MTKRGWWPGAMPDQLVLVQNFQSKIVGYANVLPLTEDQALAAVALCNAFVGSFNSGERCRATMLSMTQWRDEVLYGEPGRDAPAAPVFPVVGAQTYTTGVVKQFFQLRDLIVASPGYTLAIGEDLGIVGARITPRPPDSIEPVLKAVASTGYWINVSGSMKGMDALRVEYAPKGGTFSTVAFLTKTPGGFQITPKTPGQPEIGHVRAVYIKRNAEVGSFSSDYPVLVS